MRGQLRGAGVRRRGAGEEAHLVGRFAIALANAGAEVAHLGCVSREAREATVAQRRPGLHVKGKVRRRAGQGWDEGR